MREIDINDTGAIRRRITELQRGEFHDPAFFEQTYGLTREALDELLPLMKQHAERSPGKRPAMNGTQISRFVFEQFLTVFDLLAPAPAAARIGMDTASFARVVRHAKDHLGVPAQAIGVEGAAFREDFVARLHQFFPTLRARVFSDHTSYCKAIHAAFLAEGVEITPWKDPVAEMLDKTDVDLSHDIDIVTCGPIGLRFTVWLGFGKPFALEPDKTSALTFLRYREDLAGHVPDYFSLDTDLLARIEAKTPKAA
jgi:hypothetical protein